MEDRKLDQISDMVPRLPYALGMAAPSDMVLEHAMMPTGIEDFLNKPLLVASDNERWWRSIDLT